MSQSEALKEEIQKSLNTIKKGGIILYPTDTIWGLGCDACNPEAVEKIINLKQRPADKSFIILTDSVKNLDIYVDKVPDIAYELIEVNDKPMTIIYEKGRNVAPNVINKDGTIAIRIVKHPFCQELIKTLKHPIVSTSANINKEQSPACFNEIKTELVTKADYAVKLYREVKNVESSSIIKISEGGCIKIIRK